MNYTFCMSYLTYAWYRPSRLEMRTAYFTSALVAPHYHHLPSASSNKSSTVDKKAAYDSSSVRGDQDWMHATITPFPFLPLTRGLRFGILKSKAAAFSECAYMIYPNSSVSMESVTRENRVSRQTKHIFPARSDAKEWNDIRV